MSKCEYRARLRVCRDKLKLIGTESTTKAMEIESWVDRARKAENPEQLSGLLDNIQSECESLKGFVEEL